MKWTNPDHQLDELGAHYLKIEKLYLYGTDERAKKAYDCLKWLGVADEFDISFVLDATVLNQTNERTFCGKRVIAFQTELCSEAGANPDMCAVALPWIAQTGERMILEQIGVSNIFYLTASFNRRDNFIQNFLCVWLMYKHGKLLSHSTNLLTTLHCNLNCKYCLNFNEYLKERHDLSFEEYKAQIDTLFSKFDYLYSFHFCGGEPMLAKELPRMIRYLEEHYRNRIFEFFIITNGTLVPGQELLTAIKAMNGSFLIDDYSDTVPQTKIQEISGVLDENEIAYQINKVDHWYDLNIQNTNNASLSDEELENIKDNCNLYLQEFADGRFYACCYQKYASRAGLLPSAGNDYIEIASSSKMEILEFRQGYTKRGYVDMCRHCRGLGATAKLVPPAIQIPKKQASPASSDSPLVSICVPIYNTARYLPRCIQSLITQTYSKLEIVLVDDGSTDRSGQICDEYAALDPRVVVVHQANGGEASARNAGLTAARGEYIMFIDSDDEYLPNAVQLMLTAMKDDDIDLALGGYLERRGQVEHFATGHVQRYTAAEFAQTYLQSDCQYALPYIATTINGKMFRRNLIRDNGICFDERFVIGNDSVFMCAYLKHTRAIQDVFAAVYIYYKYQPEERMQGMSWYYPDAFFLFAYVADRMIQIMKPDPSTYRQLVAKQYQDLLYGMVNGAANQEHFQNGMLPYLTTFCDEIDFLQTGAKLDLTENLVQEKAGALPIKLLSYLIVGKHYAELYDLLQVLAKSRGMVPFRGTQVRLMIELNIPSHRVDGDGLTKQSPQDICVVGDQQFLKQIDGLIAQLLNAQKEQVSAAEASKMQIAAAEEKTAIAEARATDAEEKATAAEMRAADADERAVVAEARAVRAEGSVSDANANADWYHAMVDQLTSSSSWRITEPLRALGRLLRHDQK